MSDPRGLSPTELESTLETLLGDLPDTVSDRRARVEALGQKGDPYLLALRELEAARDGLPSDLDGIRLGRFWAQDPISITLEGWRDGTRVAVRALRPALRNDPVWCRRLERSTTFLPGPEVLSPSEFRRDPWPYVVIELPGPSLSDLLPVEDMPDTRTIARTLGGGLAGLAALHELGLVHGGVRPEHLILTADGVRLAWLDPVLPTPRAAVDDLADLGRSVALLDPTAEDSVGALARGLAEGPPPTPELAIELLGRTLGSELADRRHRLAMRRRLVTRRSDEARLLRLAHRLADAVPPPEGRWCLRAGRDAVIVIAESDGTTVKGGPVAGIDARFLPTVWGDQGLDAVGARALMRAWATRARGDEDKRGGLQTQLGGQDDEAAKLCGWLSCQARLRAVRLLLELGGR
ncbi:MAG: hypothetical protein GY913_11905 [Proteobacteria bacterium]|nr:hypothetical protein [Pseudomonadota bacterium]MCP4917619.1 hypothetical protein [Pseudomonadota bacterium]